MFKVGDRIKIKPEHLDLYAVNVLQKRDGFLTVSKVRHCYFNHCERRPLCDGCSYQFLHDTVIHPDDDNGYCMLNNVASLYYVPFKPKPFNLNENKKTDNI